MGLLDDAIREHLELKRRHGADPDEVARQENEALGATRRAEFARPEGGEGAEAPEAAAETPAAAAPEGAVDDAPFGAAPEFSPPPEPSPPPADEPLAPAPEPAPPEPVVEAQAPVEAGDEREPFDVEAEPAPPSADPWLEEERDEVPAEEALQHPRGEPNEEDVLEETPDFLQETPEHDRLWFEQRPPRPFDFDE